MKISIHEKHEIRFTIREKTAYCQIVATSHGPSRTDEEIRYGLQIGRCGQYIPGSFRKSDLDRAVEMLVEDDNIRGAFMLSSLHAGKTIQEREQENRKKFEVRDSIAAFTRLWKWWAMERQRALAMQDWPLADGADAEVDVVLDWIAAYTGVVEILEGEARDSLIEWVEGLDETDQSDLRTALAEAYCSSGSQTEVRDITPGITEPGYTDEPLAIGDWWVRVGPDADLRTSTVASMFGAMGIDTVFYDEWTICDGCYKAVRTQADSWGWKRSYWVDGSAVVCETCLAEDPSEYIEALTGDPTTAHTMDNIDLKDNGFLPVWGEFQHGLYGGQMDTPQAIAQAFEERGWEDYVFSIDSVGQFDMRFSVYLRVEPPEFEEDEWECPAYKYVAAVTGKYGRRVLASTDEEDPLVFDTAEEAAAVEGSVQVYIWPNFTPGETHADEDPAEAMKRGLQAAAKAHAALSPEAERTGGIVYTKVNGDGTASARVVSQDEFIAGINPNN